MGLSKECFADAQKNAAERLSNWIADAKQDKESGIPRLKHEYKNVFKQEWRTRRKHAAQSKYRAKHQMEDDVKYKDLRKRGDDVIAPAEGAQQLPTLPLSSHEIQDSNSSNISSRLGSYKADDFNTAENGVQYTKTPERRRTSITPGRELFNKQLTEKLQNASRYPDVTAKDTSAFGVKLHLERISSARRKKRRKYKQHMLSLEEENVHAQTVPELLLPTTTINLAPSFTSTMGAKSSTLLPRLTRRVSSAKGTVDMALKRNLKIMKHIRALSALKLNPQESYTDRTYQMSSDDKRRESLARFRRCVRLLIHVRVLLNVSRLRIEEEEKTKSFNKLLDDGNEMSFDLQMYRSATTSYGGLTTRAKHALRKNPKERNEEDAKTLLEVLIRLPIFDKYPIKVKRDLVRMMWYDKYPAGRVILKQGDPGTRMYFVVSGEVDLWHTDILESGEDNTYHYRTIKAGSTFGELALIRHMKRDYTAVSKGAEFLSLSKLEFNTVLSRRWEKECNARLEFLRNSDLFSDWTDKQLQACADASELKEYTDNRVILGDVPGLTESVYFIRKGRCEIVRRIWFVRYHSPYLRPNLILPELKRNMSKFMHKSYGRKLRTQRDECHYLTIATLHAGNYFGAGENLKDTFILSKGKTECVEINAAQFSIQSKSEQLRTLKRERELLLPSNKALYRQFQINRKWHEYRNNLLNQIIVQKGLTTHSSYNDVPFSIRNAPTISRDII